MLLSGSLLPLLRWPGKSAWRRCASIAIAGMATVAAIAVLGGMVEWRPEPFSTGLVPAALLLLAIPAFGEELLFRWLLFPKRGLPRRRVLIVLSVALFVLWHPVQAWLGFGPDWAEIFLDPIFLLAVAVAGVVLAALREASRSLWPPILFHWLLVCAWKFLGGGPF